MQASFAQHGVWVAERTGVTGPAYHLPLAIHFDGELDTGALLAACAALVARHETLRCRAEEVDGVLFLRPDTAPPITHQDLTTPGNPLPPVDDLVEEAIRRGFDLERGPLARFTLLTLAPRRHVLLFVAHHLVFDGGSKDVLVRDLAELYGTHLSTPAPTEKTPGRLGTTTQAAYEPHAEAERGHTEAETARAEAERERLEAEQQRVAAERERVERDRGRARDYWKARWRDEGEVILPGHRTPPSPRRNQPQAGEGGNVDLTVDGALWGRLAKTAEEVGVTRFEFVVTALRALLQHYGNDDVMLSLDLGTRTSETRDRIGLYVNELPLAARPNPGATFREFATGVRAGLRELYRFRHVPLTQAIGGLTSRAALTPVSVSYRKRAADPEFAGLDTRVEWTMFPHAVRNTLNVQFVENPEDLSVSLRYDTARVGDADARRVAAHFLTLLTVAAEEPDTPVGDLPVLPPEERELVSSGWNDTRVPYAPDATVLSLFAERVRATPDAEAVVHGDRRLRYAELDAISARLADRLRDAGAGTGSLVALHMERSWTMIAGMLAVMRAGAAYLPLDPAYPAERLDFILADAGVQTVLTDGGTGLAPALRQVRLDRRETAPPPLATPGTDGTGLDPGSPAYVIYTSGSTGRPKGVVVPHSALANLLLGMRDLLGAAPRHTWLALTSLSFDISALELLLPLVTGGRVVVADEDASRGPGAVELVRAERVSHVQATPSGWRMLLAAGFDARDVVALAGGEALPAPLARELRGRVDRLVNVYGPTETTIWSTAWEVPADPGAVSIGRPIANTAVYVLDGQDDLAPIGVPGELVIGGAGVATGYLGRPALTRERFVPDPLTGGRMYRTGDRARWHADGTLEFLGRADDQVKLRGHRIEPGEIEARLLEHPLIAQAAVIVREDGTGDPYLAAYVVPDAGMGFGTGELRGFLGRVLPKYMVPDHFTVVAALPLTPNGKLDRTALPDPALLGGAAPAESPVTDSGGNGDGPFGSGPNASAGSDVLVGSGLDAPAGNGDGPIRSGSDASTRNNDGPVGSGSGTSAGSGDRPGTASADRAAAIRVICQEVLRVGEIRPEDDLFDLGAHSLTITQIASRVRQRLGLEVPLQVFFDALTFGDLLDAISDGANARPYATSPGANTHPDATSGGATSGGASSPGASSPDADDRPASGAFVGEVG
ncbi:amino acid adenylation domain-containing protein [Sphaerisporangium corydalis]|uniref:Amino acid adenylation domain-containing protein n=1 Tax=Sphaerisporangium corydalis TaxID=1441875 RepID=A0ABV9E7B6_9ACTN|nr:amino acid adenylation domain-containing protein [Sphaerisporangium corydalis]